MAEGQRSRSRAALGSAAPPVQSSGARFQQRPTRSPRSGQPPRFGAPSLPRASPSRAAPPPAPLPPATLGAGAVPPGPGAPRPAGTHPPLPPPPSPPVPAPPLGPGGCWERRAGEPRRSGRRRRGAGGAAGSGAAGGSPRAAGGARRARAGVGLVLIGRTPGGAGPSLRPPLRAQELPR